ncbi:hypothetical protein [Salinibacter altiplanensis]|nr:hypothetical protein [Salinibacter altiplanensis]
MSPGFLPSLLPCPVLYGSEAPGMVLTSVEMHYALTSIYGCWRLLALV